MPAGYAVPCSHYISVNVISCLLYNGKYYYSYETIMNKLLSYCEKVLVKAATIAIKQA